MISKNFVWWEKGLDVVARFAVDKLHIDPLTFLVITAFITSLIISACCFLCCSCYCIIRKIRRNSRNENRRGLLALMFANLEEFESLTPLIVSPSSTTSSLKPPVPMAPLKSAFKPTKQQLIKAAHALTNDSPPLPRRPHSGKTLIVPLTSANNRQLRTVHNVVGTPESRITSIEAGTTKSCATIPEDEEISVEDEEDDRTDIDLISIDRTYVSTRHSCTAIKAPPQTTSTHQFNPHVPIPETVPFKEKPPLYEPPAPPWEPSAPMPQRRANIKLPTVTDKYSHKHMPGRDSPSLSSPEASSCGLESPADTTGSISDSFVIPSESDDSRTRNGGGAVYSLDTCQEKAGDISSIETDAQSTKKYHLHRIEEESEHFEDPNGSRIAAASTVSIQSQGACSGRIPRSISQQLELMKK